MAIFLRRMNKAKAKEASIQQRGPRNSFERKIMEELPSAAQGLEYNYGVRFKEIPSIFVWNGAILSDKEAWLGMGREEKRLGWLSDQGFAKLEEWYAKRERPLIRKWASKLFWSFKSSVKRLGTFGSTATYSPALEAIRLNEPIDFMGPFGKPDEKINLRVWSVLRHELTHHLIWEQRSRMYDMHKPLRRECHFARACANEGLASYSEFGPIQEPTPSTPIKRLSIGLVNRVRYALSTFYKHPILATARALCFVATDLLNGAARFARAHFGDTPEKLSKAIEKDPSFMLLVNPYRDGHRFVSNLSNAFQNDPLMFQTVTRYPPESMREILIHDEYLRRVRRDVQADLQKLG